MGGLWCLVLAGTADVTLVQQMGRAREWYGNCRTVLFGNGWLSRGYVFLLKRGNYSGHRDLETVWPPERGHDYFVHLARRGLFPCVSEHTYLLLWKGRWKKLVSSETFIWIRLLMRSTIVVHVWSLTQHRNLTLPFGICLFVSVFFIILFYSLSFDFNIF